MGLVDDIKEALGYVYGDSAEGEDLYPELGTVDTEAASEVRGLDLTSILQVLNETNSGKENDPSGSGDYKKAYEGIRNAIDCQQKLKDLVYTKRYTAEDAKQYMEKLAESYRAVGDYIIEKEKGVFFKHPVTPKGKKRLACMKNAHNIMDAIHSYYFRMETQNDNQNVDISIISVEKAPTSYFRDGQLQRLSRANEMGLDNAAFRDDLYEVAHYMTEDLFEPKEMTKFLRYYKTYSLEIPVKALLIRRNTPAANRSLVSAFELGGPNLAEQIDLTYDLLAVVNDMADELWRNLVDNDKGEKSEPDAMVLLTYKKEILRLMRMLNLDRKINARGLERL